MKKRFLSVLCILLFVFISIKTQAQTTASFTEIYFPQYMYGNGISGGSVVPYAYYAKLSGLQAGGVYKYLALAVPSTQGTNTTTIGAGAFLVPDMTNAFVRVSSSTLNVSGTFTADANGEYTGWFISLASGVRFTSGSQMRMQINVSGAGNSTIEKVYYSVNLVKLINFGTSSTLGTGIYSTAAAGGTGKKFVMLYDTDDASGRPITGTFLEDDGFDVSTVTSGNAFAAFYRTNVDKVDRAWGAIIPNALPSGIRKIVQYNYDGTVAGTSSSTDGKWAGTSGEVNTVNPSGGVTPIVLNGAVVAIAPPPADPEMTFVTPVPAEVLTTDGDFSAAVTSKSNAAVIYSTSDAAVVTIDNAGMVHIGGAGTAEIKAIQPASVFYLADTVTATITVRVPKPVPALAFSGNFPVAVILGTPDFNAGVTSNSAAPVAYSSSNATVATIDGNGIVHVLGTGNTTITASQQENADFKAATVSVVLTVVDKQVPTVSFQPFSVKIYGDALFDPVAVASSGAAPAYTTSNPSVAQIVNGQIRITGAGSADITALFPATAAYSEISATQTLTVQKKALVIIAENKTRKQDVANPLLTVVYQGFVNGDTNTNALQAQPVIATDAVISSAPGVYAINVSGAASANYAISYVPGSLTVELVMKSNVISFPPFATRDYGQADFETGATASSGLPVTLMSSNTNVAVIVGGKVRITGAGTANITASQAGDATHVEAVSVSQTLTVRKVFLTVTPADTAKRQGEANPVFRAVYAGFVNGDNASVLTAAPVITTMATTSSPAGVYELLAGGAMAANYDIVYGRGKFTVNSANGAVQDEVLAYCDAPGQLKITVFVQANAKVVIQLFDGTGKKVVDMPVSVAKGFTTFHVNVSRLSSGVYPLRIVGGEVVLKSKVVIR